MLSTLNFLLCFSTNLNVLLAICMLFCFLEGLWDDLKLERLFIKTNDLVQRKDMMFFSTSNLFLSSGLVSKTPILPYFPGAGAGAPKPWRHGAFPRADASSFSQTSLEKFVGPVLGHFWGEEGYEIQIVFGRIFLFLRIFVVGMKTIFYFKRNQLEDPSCKSLS